jgi:16S rRNA (guanine966-N2)-methyltransferase
MRIIAGSAGGIPLRVPDGDVRPTSDRVREALFSVLAGIVPGARCLDLYAGSGALGIEALSRGAESCLFVDRSRASCEAVRANLTKAKLAGGDVRCSEVDRFLRGASGKYDLVFADPPYAKPGGDDLAGLLALSEPLVEMLAPGATLLLESRKGAGEYPHHERLESVDLREYGDTQLVLYRRSDD